MNHTRRLLRYVMWTALAAPLYPLSLGPVVCLNGMGYISDGCMDAFEWIYMPLVEVDERIFPVPENELLSIRYCTWCWGLTGSLGGGMNDEPILDSEPEEYIKNTNAKSE